MIRAVMADSGAGFADLDLLAVTRGPGGFTGLRIGLAAARGMAFAGGLPLADKEFIVKLGAPSVDPVTIGLRQSSTGKALARLYLDTDITEIHVSNFRLIRLKLFQVREFHFHILKLDEEFLLNFLFFRFFLLSFLKAQVSVLKS